MNDVIDDDVHDSGSAEPADEIDRVRDLVTYLAKALVDDPEGVSVEAVDGDQTVVLELTVSKSDLGKVIGREGRTARAMRTLLSATSAKLRRRTVLEILE